MGYVAIAAGFLVLVLLCLVNINVMIAAFCGAVVVTVLTGLPFTETLVTTFFTRFGLIAGNLFPMFLFGAILAKLYTGSGAASTIAEGVCRVLFRKTKTDRARYHIGFLSVIIASAILCYGGINAAVALIAIYPIALGIFKRAGIPKRFIMGAICGGAFTFALSGPGSPQPTNVVAMAIGTSSYCGLIGGLAGALTEIAVMTFVLSALCEKAVKNGEHFALGAKDKLVQTEDKNVPFLVAGLPILVLLIGFNVFGISISLAILLTALVAAAAFYSKMGGAKIIKAVNEGAVSAMVPAGAIAAVNGFAAVVQEVPEYQIMIDKLLTSKLPPILLLIVGVSIICMITGGSTTGTQIALPILAPVLTNFGMPLPFIHRVGTFAATTLDSLPNSGSVIMAVGLADLKMKEGYPPVFVSTVLATISGTLVTALIMYLFPALP